MVVCGAIGTPAAVSSSSSAAAAGHSLSVDGGTVEIDLFGWTGMQRADLVARATCTPYGCARTDSTATVR